MVSDNPKCPPPPRPDFWPRSLQETESKCANIRPLVRRGFSCIGLDNPKTDVNVGSALRAAGIFECDMVAISGHRYSRSRTDTMRSHKHLPLLQVDDLHDVIPYDCIPVAVELVAGAMPLTNYHHPERAFYVFGAEDATLGTIVLSWCRDVIYIPTNGCLNLAACVNVVLYDRMCKSGRIFSLAGSEKGKNSDTVHG